MMSVVGKFKVPGKAVRARVCDSLQDARDAPYFFEYFFSFCQKQIPYGDEYESWRQNIDERMRAGYEIAGIGPYS